MSIFLKAFKDAEIPLAGQAPNQNDQFGGFFGMNSGKVKHQLFIKMLKSHKMSMSIKLILNY